MYIPQFSLTGQISGRSAAGHISRAGWVRGGWRGDGRVSPRQRRAAGHCRNRAPQFLNRDHSLFRHCFRLGIPSFRPGIRLLPSPDLPLRVFPPLRLRGVTNQRSRPNAAQSAQATTSNPARHEPNTRAPSQSTGQRGAFNRSSKNSYPLFLSL